jgi:hypothetical protein
MWSLTGKLKVREHPVMKKEEQLTMKWKDEEEIK